MSNGPIGRVCQPQPGAKTDEKMLQKGQLSDAKKSN